jgi:hypothetical protein
MGNDRRRAAWVAVPPLEREDLANLGRAVVVSVLFAVGVTLAGLVLALVAVAPTAGLFIHLPTMLADPSARVTMAVGLCAGIYAFRRPSLPGITWWLRRHDVPDVMAGPAAAELRRMRVVRVVPAVLGVAVGGGALTANNVAATVLPEGDAALQALYRVVNSYDFLEVALGGYLLGVLLSEITRRPVAVDGAVARLETRTPGQYLTPTAQRLPAALAVWCVVAAAAGAVLHRPPAWYMVGGALVVPVVVAVVQRHIVRRSQRVTDDAALLALDDTLRSSAAHGLSGGASALVLAWALTLTQQVVIGDGVDPGLLGVLLGLASIVGVYGLWRHYGAVHRGRRPRRGMSATP